MAATGIVTISGLISGLLTGTKTLTGYIPLANAVGEILPVVLQSGANTIAVPVGATGVMIAPPASNTVILTLKGVTGDTGVAIAKNLPTFIALDPGVTSFVITAASLTVLATELSFV